MEFSMRWDGEFHVVHLPTKKYKRRKCFSDVRDDLIKRLVRAESEIHRLARKNKVIKQILHKI